MNLSKIMKQKRDAEVRLSRQSPEPTFSSNGTTETYIDISGLALKSDIKDEIVELNDVDITLTGNAGKVLKVNATGTGIDLGTGGGADDFLDLTDTPSAYTGEGGKIVAVKSTADGLEFIAAPAATNGIPIGGTAGQVLKKVDGTNYNATWTNENSNAASLLTKAINIPDFTGKDDYILAYDETAGEFYLKLDDAGGGGNSGFGEYGFVEIPITLTTMDIT